MQCHHMPWYFLCKFYISDLQTGDSCTGEKLTWREWHFPFHLGHFQHHDYSPQQSLRLVATGVCCPSMPLRMNFHAKVAGSEDPWTDKSRTCGEGLVDAGSDPLVEFGDPCSTWQVSHGNFHHIWLNLCVPLHGCAPNTAHLWCCSWMCQNGNVCLRSVHMLRSHSHVGAYNKKREFAFYLIIRVYKNKTEFLAVFNIGYFWRRQTQSLK